MTGQAPDEAHAAATLILAGFEAYRQRFRAITRRARSRFARHDWLGIRKDTVERMGLHGRRTAEVYAELARTLDSRAADRAFWAELKRAYAGAVAGRDDRELAQTFFNSLARRAFAHEGLDPAIDFLPAEFPQPDRAHATACARTYGARRIDEAVVKTVLNDAGLKGEFLDPEEDALLAAERLDHEVLEAFGTAEIDGLDVLQPLFVRNKAAYVVARARHGGAVLPFLLAIVHARGGLRVDAVIATAERVSPVFSFARWYFHADAACPRDLVAFLHTLLPRKRVAELYLALGEHKHAKTELYADLMRTIAASDERFVPAPGRPGTVMSAFTLPSYEFVFKVVRDTFPPNKAITRREVVERYRQVMLHDRVGRLVDFQEFEHLVFPRRRFDPALLEHLLAEASSAVSTQGEEVRIRHLLVGRRVVPLDLFLREAPPEKARAAALEWGRSIKDMVAANIFPGDMLPKNFGVTRHGRVVFYDYDELCPVTACRFRRLPPARDDDDDARAEPWFSVGEGDVFPEELPAFLGLPPNLKELFLAAHGDLFDVEYWRRMQERIRLGEAIDFFPYSEAARLHPTPRQRPPL